MDKNKLEKLKEIGYHVNPSCGLCKHGTFPSDQWGTCNITTYTHQKHSDQVRQLSIHESGHCSRFEWDPVLLANLHGFKDLL